MGSRASNRRCRGQASLADFVLDPFGADERACILERLPILADAIERTVRDGITAAMNAFNGQDEPC
jgi:peptidyl-tRNA hydrolase